MSSTGGDLPEDAVLPAMMSPLQCARGGLLSADPVEFHEKFISWKSSGGANHIFDMADLFTVTESSVDSGAVAPGPSRPDTACEHGEATEEVSPAAAVSEDASTAGFAVVKQAVTPVHSATELVVKLYEIVQAQVNWFVAPQLRFRFLGRGVNQHMDLWRVVECRPDEYVSNETEFFLPHAAATLSAEEKRLIYKVARNWNGCDALTTSIVVVLLKKLFAMEVDVIELQSAFQRPTLQSVTLGKDGTLVYSDDLFMLSPTNILTFAHVDGVAFDPVFGTPNADTSQKEATDKAKKPLDPEEIIFAFITSAGLTDQAARAYILAAIGESYREARKIAMVE